jgi:hypothetical protein
VASDIPHARNVLLALADDLDDAGLTFEAGVIRNVVDTYMRRSFIGRFTPVKRGSLNPGRAARIRDYARQHPDASQDEIGRVFNVAGGRVSEALAGHNWSPNRAAHRP